MRISSFLAIRIFNGYRISRKVLQYHASVVGDIQGVLVASDQLLSDQAVSRLEDMNIKAI